MKVFAKKTPWYAAGLAFECVGCGRCCEGPEEGYVWVTDEEIAAIAGFLGLPEAEMRRRYVRDVFGRKSLVEVPGNRDCVFLQKANQGGRQCRVYAVRPKQCRTWPFWANNLRHPDDWAEAGRRCPGINRGPVASREHIDACRHGTNE